MTTSQTKRPITTEHTSDVARNAFIIGVSAVVLTLAWWLSPVVGGILTIVASVILAAVLAPGTTDIDGQNGHDRSHDASWYL